MLDCYREKSVDEMAAIFVIGHSPAIITETLAAMASDGEAMTEIRVCTTASGAAILKQALFDQGGWRDFVAEYPQYGQTRFSPKDFLVPAGLDDIRGEEDNRAMVETILAMVRKAVEERPRVLASIAGGRKTMGYYLGFAMSLFGRPHDRLTHVLVPAEWEQNRDFLFPSSSEAHRIDLVEVPFIRVHDHLGSVLRNMDIDQLVTSAQTAVDLAAHSPAVLRIKQRSLEFLGRTVELGAREFSILQFFVQQKLKRCQRPDASLCGDCQECFLSFDEAEAHKEELFSIRVQFGGVNSAHYEQFEEKWGQRHAFSALLPEALRRIHEAIEQVHGIDPRAEALMIRNVGKRGSPAYGIMGDKGQFRIERN